MRSKRRLSKQLLSGGVLIWITVYTLSYFKQTTQHGIVVEQSNSDEYMNSDGLESVMPVVESNQGFRQLEKSLSLDLKSGQAVVNRSQAKILILSMERAGSSFIGEILSRLPQTYYSVDPLYFLQFGISNNTFIQDYLLGKNVSYYLDNLLRCNFKLILQASAKYFPKENGSREELVRKAFPNTESTEAAMSTCGQQSKTVVKVTNVRYIKDVMSLLEDPLTTVIYVIRDPRGIMNSIIKTDNVNHHGELYYNQTSNLQQQVRSICDPLLENLKYIKTSLLERDSVLNKKSSLFILRFEDVAYHPRDLTTKLFEYFGAVPNQHLLDWLDTITTSSAYSRNPYSTVRNSSTVPEAWRDGLSFRQVQVIEEECAHVLWEYGYWTADTDQVLQDKSKTMIDLLPKHLPQL